MQKQLTDEEVVCSFTEPRPGPDSTHPDFVSILGWWRCVFTRSSSWRWIPNDDKTDSLDALWEVEERLTDEQWTEYRGWFMVEHQMDGHRVPFGTYILHATPAQKIKALATVLRPLLGEKK